MEIVNGLSLDQFIEIIQQLATMIYGCANTFFKLFLLDLKVFDVPIGFIFLSLAIISSVVYTLLNSSSD